MAKHIFSLIDGTVLVAVISFIVKLVDKNTKKIEVFFIKYEIINVMQVFGLVQVELIGMIGSIFGAWALSTALYYKLSFGDIFYFILLSGIFIILNVIGVFLMISIIKDLRKLPKKNIVDVLIMDIIFLICLFMYSLDVFTNLRKYANLLLNLEVLVILSSQFICNCKRVRVKNIEYIVETLNFEHYTIKNKPRLIGEIYTIKISNTRIIEIPVNRIKKITLNITDIDEKVSDAFDKK